MTIGLGTPTINFAVLNQTYGAAPFPVAATSNSTGAITYSVVSGPATISGATVTLTGAGSVILKASQAADSNYIAGSTNAIFTVGAGTPTINFAVLNQTYGAAPFGVSATSNSTGAITYSVVSGPATISGATVTLTGAGSVTLKASQAADSNYIAGSTNAIFTVGAGTPTINFAVLNQTYGAAPFAVSATSNSTGAITYSVVSGPATISGSTVTLTGAGSVILKASQAADSNYAAGSTNATFTVGAGTPTINFAVLNQTYGAAPFGVSATSNSTGAITYSVVSGPATISGSTVTLTGAGSVTLKASQAADSNYIAGSATAIFTVGAGTPTINFTVLNQTYGAAPFAVSATSNSTGAITYSVVSGPATISGATVTLTGAGSVTLKASQAADSNYAAGSTNATFTVGAGTPTINFAVLNQTYGAAPFPVAATSNSTGAITYSVVSGPATISGSTVTLTGAGSVTLKASQAADSNYIAGSTNAIFTVGAGTPTINFAVLNQTYGAAPFGVSATSNSTGAITYSVVSGPATISGSTVTLTGAGSVTLKASQAADSNYIAGSTNAIFTVGQATLTVTAADASRIYGTANPTFSASAIGAANGDTFTFAESTTATVASPVGTYPIVPIATGANLADYNVIYVNGTLTVGKAALTVTAADANRIYGTANPTFSASAIGAANGDTFTFAESTTATVASPVGTYPIVPIATGTNLADYNVIYVNGTLTVGKAALTVNAADANRIYGTANPTFSASAIGAANGDTFTFAESTTATVASPVGTYPIVPIATGTNLADYNVISVNGTLAIGQATPVVTWANPTTVVYGTALGIAQLNATASVPGAFVYTPSAGSVPGAGANTLSVSFTPADATDYTSVVRTVQLTVNQSTPVITWPNPANITYGTALSIVQLDATANLAGTFVYTPASGTEFMVGLQQLSVTFTPTDLTNYSTATKTVPLNVTRATLTIAANSFTRLYGTPNPTFTGNVTGSENSDTFTETFSTSAITLTTVGQYPISPAATGTNLADYTQVVQNGTLSITKAPALTTTTLSTTSIPYGLNVTIAATVASTTSGTPTGTVNFFDNGTPLGTVPISNGVATFSSAALPVGANVITAIYSGDVNFLTSTANGTSGSTTVMITPLDFSIQLTSQSTVEGTYGTTRQYTFHIAPIGGSYPDVVQLQASPTGPILATYTFSPASIGKTAGPMDVTLTVATRKLASSELPGGASPVAFGLFLLPLLGLRYSRRSAGKLTRIISHSALVLLSLGAIGTMTGCGSGYFDHTYPITITATSNTVQHTVNVQYHIDQSPQ